MTKVFGVDVAGEVISSGTWSMLVEQQQIEFAVVRAYRNAHGGIIDNTCLQTVANARIADLTDLSVYHFPIIISKAPEKQAQETIDFLDSNNISISCLWLDVETDGADWHVGDPSKNVEFIRRFAETCDVAKIRMGIYCGTNGWAGITGNTSKFSTRPLWWSSHGNVFSTFGGWNSADQVQFKYEQKFNDISYDLNYRLS
jgi:hypothetical protein